MNSFRAVTILGCLTKPAVLHSGDLYGESVDIMATNFDNELCFNLIRFATSKQLIKVNEYVMRHELG